jgi:hypothetical protein
MNPTAGSRAQVESLGSILLVAVVVVSATTFGAYYISSATGGSASGGAGSAGGASGTPIEITMTATEASLTLSHNGGPSVSTDALRVVVKNSSGEFSVPFASGQIRDGDGEDGQFDPGETWELGWDQAVGSEITVSVINDATETLLLQQTTTIGSPAESDTDGRADGTDADEQTLTVDAGPQRTVSGKKGSVVGLDGSTDATGDNIAYQWEIIDYDGISTDAVVIADADSLDSTFEVRQNVTDANHTVVVELTVENATASGEDRTTVTVEQANRPPVADAGEDKEIRADEGDDEDGHPGEGPPEHAGPDNIGGSVGGALTEPGVPSAAVIYPVSIEAIPIAADVDNGADDIEEEFVELNGTGSWDPDGDELSYGWEITDRDGLAEETITLVDSESATPKVVLVGAPPSETRTVTVELTVSDVAGATDTDQVNVRVYPESDDDDGFWGDFWDDFWGDDDDEPRGGGDGWDWGDIFGGIWR